VNNERLWPSGCGTTPPLWIRLVQAQMDLNVGDTGSLVGVMVVVAGNLACIGPSNSLEKKGTLCCIHGGLWLHSAKH
jgi:hypothetical protein